MISSVGSYDVTALSADRSNSALVAIGWPISRLLPRPMISSGCSLASAARTACSTSLASRTLRVSTPIASLHRTADAAVHILLHLLKMWPPGTRPGVTDPEQRFSSQPLGAGSRRNLEIAHRQRFQLRLAGKHDLHRASRAAIGDLRHRTIRRRHPAIAPLRQGIDGREQIEALLVEMIFGAAALLAFPVFDPLQNPGVGQRFQPGAENPAAAFQRMGEIVEPAHAVDRLAQYQQRPFLA